MALSRTFQRPSETLVILLWFPIVCLEITTINIRDLQGQADKQTRRKYKNRKANRRAYSHTDRKTRQPHRKTHTEGYLLRDKRAKSKTDPKRWLPDQTKL